MKIRKLIPGAAVGAAAAYLFDPDRGRSRRARLADQAGAAIRRAGRSVISRMRYQGGAARGLAYRLTTPFRQEGPFDDDTLLQKVRSEALGPWSSTVGDEADIEVEVRGGVVTLTGVVGTPQSRSDLMDRIGKVDGVELIRDDVVTQR